MVDAPPLNPNPPLTSSQIGSGGASVVEVPPLRWVWPADVPRDTRAAPAPPPTFAQLVPPDDGFYDTKTRRTRWGAPIVCPLPFGEAALARYSAGRLRRMASHMLAGGLEIWGEFVQDVAEDLERAYSVPPPGHGEVA